MPHDDEPDTGVQDAITGFVQNQDPDDSDGRELMEAVADSNDANDVETAVALASQRTSMNEEQLRSIVNEHRRSGFTVEGITKFLPWADDGEVEWHFHVTANGDDATLVLVTSDLRTDSKFRDQILEVTNQVIPEFEEWGTQLDQWLAETEIEEKRHPPISNEHAIANKIVEAIDSKDTTTDRERFTNFPGTYNYCEVKGDNLVKVSGDTIHTCRDSVKGEVSPRKVRSILDPVLAKNTEQVRSESGKLRVWVFNREALEDQGVELRWEDDDPDEDEISLSKD